MNRLFIVITLTSALGLNLPAWAEDPASGAQIDALCKDQPEKCQQWKQQFQDKCNANPERCAQFKAKAAEWRQRCTQDPQACEEKKAKLRERLEKRRAQ